MPPVKQVARLNIRLAPDIKRTIERAAAHMGQTVSDFATASLIQAARVVIQDQNVTRLSEQDRRRFVAALEDTASKPNAALVKAVRRYKKQVR